jgi:hypothetical protein
VHPLSDSGVSSKFTLADLSYSTYLKEFLFKTYIVKYRGEITALYDQELCVSLLMM